VQQKKNNPPKLKLIKDLKKGITDQTKRTKNNETTGAK
jgi:hypothetical protein